RAGLVVRARGTRAAERLLPDDRTGWLVVDVEVARRVAELVLRIRRSRPILREDGACQAVRSGAVDERQRLIPRVFVVNVGRDDRPEDLVAQQPEAGVARLDHRWIDEVALRVVVAAADDDVAVGVRLRLLD